MTHLPDTDHTQDDQLQHSPPYHTRVGQFWLIPEFNFTFLYAEQLFQSIASLCPSALSLTRWESCSRRISWTRSFSSCTFLAKSMISKSSTLWALSYYIKHASLPDNVSLWSCPSPAGSSKSISNVIFYGRSRTCQFLSPPHHSNSLKKIHTVFVESNHEAGAGERQIEWSPDSADVKVNRPLAPPWRDTTMLPWGISSTEISILTCSFTIHLCWVSDHCSEV